MSYDFDTPRQAVYDKYHEAMNQLVLLALAQYVAVTLDHWPTATHIEFSVSDQGGGTLFPTAIHDGDTVLVEEDPVELENVPLDLDDANLSLWVPFMEPQDPKIRRKMGPNEMLRIDHVIDALDGSTTVPNVKRPVTS